MELLNLRDLITEQTSELNYIYPLQDIDGYLCVIGQSGCQSGNFRQLTYKIISALVDNCNSQGLVLNAGIGAIVQDLWDLNRSYESAVHALDYRFFFHTRTYLTDVRLLDMTYLPLISPIPERRH